MASLVSSITLDDMDYIDAENGLLKVLSHDCLQRGVGRWRGGVPAALWRANAVDDRVVGGLRRPWRRHPMAGPPEGALSHGPPPEGGWEGSEGGSVDKLGCLV